jgi:hypothetical protein
MSGNLWEFDAAYFAAKILEMQRCPTTMRLPAARTNVELHGFVLEPGGQVC